MGSFLRLSSGVRAIANAFLGVLFMSACWIVCPRGHATDAAGRPPNIVLVVADDLGYGELGCYGQKSIRTPHLDALAKQGVRFTNFYAGSPVCAPSRCVLMTGKHSGNAFIRDNRNPPKKPYAHLQKTHQWKFPGQTPLPLEEITLGEALKQRGYATAAIGKWGLGHIGTTGDPNRQGFDLFYGFNCQVHAHNHYPRFLWRNSSKEGLEGNRRELSGETYSQDRFTDMALQFIRNHREQPFLLYLPLAIPHLSIQVPAASLAEYQGELPEEAYEHRGYLEHPSPRAGYAAMVSHMDRDIGKIVALIGELGLGEETLIIFTSDNGPTYDRLGGSDSVFFNSTGGLRGYKGSVYEGGLRVPLLVRWLGKIPSGQTCHIPTAFWDIMPTACEVAGSDVPSGVDGVSLVPLLTNASASISRTFLLWEFAGYGGQQAIRRGDWKAIRRNISKGNDHWELYNLASDPKETTDRSHEHPEIVERLADLLESNRTDSALFPMKESQGAKEG